VVAAGGLDQEQSMSEIQKALNKAMAAVAKTGIAKLSRASLGGSTVNYRGIEAAMNVMSVILIECGITVTPSYSELTIQERIKGDPKDGKALRFVTVKGAFTFSAADGSSVVCTVYGEAMDSGDKAAVKAQSVAFRTALFQQFVAPTVAMDPEEGGDDDDDPLLETFREAAMQGTVELQRLFKDTKPPEAFWKRHSEALKAAAKEADKVPA
jgi:hypothetical protein